VSPFLPVLVNGNASLRQCRREGKNGPFSARR
jgi:hypothetical protein